MNKIAKNPSKLLPQLMPNVLNIWVANSGKQAPKHDRMKSFPAEIDAKFVGYASPR